MILSPFQLAHYFYKDLIYILMNANDDLEFFMAIELGLFKKKIKYDYYIITSYTFHTLIIEFLCIIGISFT